MLYQNPHGASCPWYQITELQGAPNLKWCEETLCSWISEPANTWSNLGYLAIGLFIMWKSSKDRIQSPLIQFGPIVFLMGSLSFFYHQSNFYGTQLLDFVGMFLLVGWVSGMNLIRAGKLKEQGLISYNLTYTAINSVLVHLMYRYGFQFQVLVLIGALIIVGTEILAARVQRGKYHWFVISLVLLGIALTFSIMDHSRTWCDPIQHGLLSQGHALWHWIGSLAMLTIYLHYKTNYKCQNHS